MELFGCPWRDGLSGAVQELEVTPTTPGLGDQAGEVKPAVRRELKAQRANDLGQIIEQVRKPEAQD